MVSFRRHALITPLLLSSAALAAGACANAPEEPSDDLATAQQALDPVCVTLRRGEAGDVGDTFLSGDYPTWAPGTDWGVWTGVSSGGNFNQALYSFDISPVPAGATVTSATFSVYQSWSASYNQVGVHRVTGPWSEATTTSANFDPAFLQGTPDVSFAAGGVGLRSVNVAPIVQEWVSGAPNYGFALVEPPVNRHYFFTSEVPTVARRPSLTVCYTEAACDDGVQSPGEVGVDCGGPCEACECTPDSTAPCYTGPAGTEGVGACAAGTQTCNADGSDYGACTGDVTPAAEDCATAADDDCDGVANEGCVCTPSILDYCYSGPAGTLGVGLCAAGTRMCNADGTAWGACTGQVLPGAESCANATDDDCDGTVNESCALATCGLYTENWDDGNAGEVTSGNYKIGWCDTVIPTAQNTPICGAMSGRTLRTNASTEDPTIWVSRGSAPCTSAKITYTYYQFASAGVTLQYQRSNDTVESCEKAGAFSALTSPATLQTCVTQSSNVTFNGFSSIYFRFEHGAGGNALWLDDVSIELQGCSCN